MTCDKCGEKPKKNCGAFPKAVIEIDNPEKIVLLRKVLVPASMGDESTFPPTIGKYHNVLLEYEASGGIYLYSSDGIPTKLSSDVTELQAQLNALRVRIGQEEVARADADTALSNRITSLDNSLATVARTGSYNDLSDKPTIGDGTLTIKKNGSNVGTFTANATTNTDVNIVVPTKTSDLANDGSDGASQYVESNDLATVATSGSYNDLTNKPTIGNATLTIKRNDTNAGTFTANATTNKSINIAVPTKTSDLTNDGSDGTSTYVESDDLPTVDTTYSSSSNNAIANSTVTNSLDRNVMTNLAVDSTPSTTTVNLNNTKTNLAYPSSSTTSSISLPVASSTQAGVMNSATFDAVTSNTNNINAILNGAVAISNLPASPTQAQLTTAWENETGLPSLINRASVYDVTNNKVWTYYTNDQTWHAASNTSQVTVNTFTNSSEGTIKGSTNAGQVFAESDGTGSVNGWDTLTGNVANNTSKLATIEQGAEVNVQANWTQTNASADDYIKNKPANLVQDANYVHTDNNFTTTLKNKLDGIESGAEVNVQADWSQTDTTADDYIKNKPTIPTVNNATLTIQKNGVNVQTFTANSSTNKTANITVPTAVSELTNDSGYATTTQLNNGLATKQDTLTAGSNIQINGNTISATDTTYAAGNAIDITNGEISADVHPADFFTAEDTVSDCGSDLSLDDTMDSTLRSVELKGDTSQQTYSGKNLSPYPYSDGSSKVIGGITFTAASDGSVTLNGTNDGAGNSAYYIYYGGSSTLQFEAGTYYFIPPSNTAVGYVMYDGTSYYDFSSSNNYSQTLSSAKNIRDIYIQVRKGNTTVFNNLKIYPMLTTSPNPTESDYEPYVGGYASPSPEYPQDIHVVTGEQTVEVTGKNIVNIGFYDISGTNYALKASYGNIKLNSTSANNSFDLNTGAQTGVWLPSYGNANDYHLTGFGGTYTVSVQNFVNRTTGSGNTVLQTFTNKRGAGQSIAADTTSVNPLTINLDDDEYIKSIYLWTPSGAIVDMEMDIQLEQGSTATDYEPYRGQSYEINLGKNIWSSSMEVGGISANGTNLSNDKRVRSTTKVVVRPGTTYTLSATPRDSGKVINVAIQGWTSDGTFLSQITGADWQTLPLTFTTPANCYKVTLNGRYSDDTVFGTVGESTDAFQNIQLEAGANATEYAPHFAPIELCKIGDYQDYIYKSGDDWYLHKETAEYTFNGTENWGAAGEAGSGYYGYWKNISQQGLGIAGYTLAYMAHFKQRTYGSGVREDCFMLNGATGNVSIVIITGSIATVANFKTWLANNNVVFYYCLATPTDTQITDATLIGQLEALAKAKSYNDQTNILVTAAGNNLPATLCVEAYRKSLSGVIEAIDSACTCRQNLVVHLPNGMTTYTNNDAPIPIPEVVEALKRGQSVFLVDDALPESIYVVTAASAEDEVCSMRADQTGINPRVGDGHWHIGGGGDVWDSVTFVNDATPSKYSLNIYNKTWFAFTSSTPLLDQNRRTYYPASSDMVFNNTRESLSVAELWEKLASSAWDGNPVILEVPLQGISTRTTSLVDTGFSAESPYLTITVPLGPDSYFKRETSEHTITGWAAECTPITFDGKESYMAGIVKVVENGNTTYSFVVSLTEVNSIN